MTLGTYGLDSNYVNQMGGRNVEKAKFASSPSSVLFYCTGFARPSRAITSATFGSDLNIETLVAAAERKETPLEPPKHLTCPTKTREALNICKSAVTTCS
ncbi:uncharacterized protein LOC114312709 isoform X2 [Camellia sinensis]|uniref:uncharacterized protein LOC114312709 isoform X2 n=1 Tax=Camellia sinensis TaxID=4442 RepID=UPI0010358FCE|nr:uncharacterized protein LOC114312709 isoform X2 [Camellia sinensis]